MTDGTGSSVRPAPGDPSEEILGRVLALPLAEQAGALERACAEHPGLEARLREGFEFLKNAGMLDSPAARDFPEKLGDLRLLSKLGGGGMGLVYLARQEPLDRTVAVKVMRPEQLYCPAARERFRREYEAIARLQHPGIVPIYTVGEAEGIPYFVMERIEGRTLAEILADLRGLSPESISSADLAEAVGAPPAAAAFRGSYAEACLRIAKQVADALAHAHGRGILHRDVKPSNVIVSADGCARLLDFGLTSSAGEERITKSGAQVGTLLYMSPEQLRSGRDDLDARTDVYSLGVTLYELLTLQPPYAGDDAVSTQALILEGIPHPIAARNRRVSPEAAAVCLKAMEAERAARYQTAEDFASDLENALAMRPVRAKPAGLARRVRRFIQRRPALSSAVVLGFLLLVGAPTALWIQAARHAGVLEAGQKALREENQVAAQTLAVLEGLLNGASPYKQAGRDARVVDLLAVGEERVRKSVTLLPSVRFRLLTTLAQVRLDLADYALAAGLLEDALTIAESERGQQSQQYFRTLSMLADARAGLGKTTRAIEMKRRAVELAAIVFGPGSSETSIEKHGLANLLLKAGKPDEAADLFREGVAYERAAGRDESGLAAGLIGLANAESKLDRFSEAEAHFAEGLAIQRRVLPSDHPDYAMSLYAYATMLKRANKLAEADPIYLDCRDRLSRIFGRESEQMGLWALSYGGLLEVKGDRAAALRTYDDAAEILANALSEGHPAAVAAREKRDRLK